MSHEQAYTELLGALPAGRKAYVLEMPSASTNAFKLLSKNIVGTARVAKKGNALYVEAESFTHADAVQLQV